MSNHIADAGEMVPPMTDPKEALIERPDVLLIQSHIRAWLAVDPLITALGKLGRMSLTDFNGLEDRAMQVATEAADALASLSASVGVTDEQVSRACEAAGWVAVPETAPRESGVPTGNDLSVEEADEINASMRESMRDILSAALSLPSSGGEVVAE